MNVLADLAPIWSLGRNTTFSAKNAVPKFEPTVSLQWAKSLTKGAGWPPGCHEDGHLKPRKDGILQESAQQETSFSSFGRLEGGFGQPVGPRCPGLAFYYLAQYLTVCMNGFRVSSWLQ